MKKGLLLIIGIIVFKTGFSQYYCGTPNYIKALSQSYKGFEKAYTNSYKNALINSKRINSRRGKKIINKVFEIPVVFHVLYKTGAENLDKSIILNQLEILNENFQRKNKDTINLRNEFLPVAGNPRIKFILAKKDPNGNTSNGIVRVKTNKTSFGNIDIKVADINIKQTANGGSDSWDTEKYLNIWICNLSVSGFDFLLGYAFPPLNAKHWPTTTFLDNKKHEGVVLHFKACGANNPNATTLPSGKRLGKTLVHEVGHFLGLRHIWADGDCSKDDGLEDTPTAATRSNSCNKNKNTCTDNTNEQNDMIENFMDYSPGNCQNTFTKKQVALMQYNLIHLRTKLTVLEYEAQVLENKIYPIPANNVLNIQLKNDNSAEYSIKIIDAYGRTMFEKTLLNASEQKLNLVNYPNGVYTVIISEQKIEEDLNKIINEKIVVIHQ